MRIEIKHLSALEILDSRGRPTLKVKCTLEDGTQAAASVPSGASTGAAEAHELRDGDPGRYGGLGCRKAAGQVNGAIQNHISGRAFSSQTELDQALLELDGTADKSRLGTNAILGVSLAFARAQALHQGKMLYQYFGEMIGHEKFCLPLPMVNLYSGGRHAGGQVSIQDLQVVPLAAISMDEALAGVYAIFQAAAELSLQKYGMRLLRADEGGQAPPFPHSPGMLSAALQAVRAAGFEPGHQVAFAVDVAASHFFQNGNYVLDGEELTGSQMLQCLESWVESFPILSLEDGLAEEDWAGWQALSASLGEKIVLIGDDFLCTNPERIQQAIDRRAANGLLLKANQIGTMSEAAVACRLARRAGWKVIASARSGETEDDWLADLAVGWGADFIKIGSITQSERLAKYNRLLEIENTQGLELRRLPWR